MQEPALHSSMRYNVNKLRLTPVIKNDYLAQQNIDEKKISLEIIDRIEKIIIDGQISIHELLNELEKLDQILNNPFLTNEGREHLNALREVIVGSLNEYGKKGRACQKGPGLH